MRPRDTAFSFLAPSVRPFGGVATLGILACALGCTAETAPPSASETAALVTADAGSSSSSSYVPPALDLPPPTGIHTVGATNLYLRDANRADPWVPSERRELMLTIWYPSLVPLGPPAPYVTPAVSAIFVAYAGLSQEPPDLFATIQTHGHLDAPPLPRWHGLPLIVLSPGIQLPRSSLTALAEELASRGFVVAAIDHNYEALAIQFPDGRITQCLICQNRPPGPVATASRAADVSFVLDELLADASAWPYGWTIDRERVAMVGMSLGGSSTMATMLVDPRVTAGVNLDGPFLPALDQNMSRPFMMLGRPLSLNESTNATWPDSWPYLTGWRRWLTVDGMDHNSFTDYAVLFPALGIPLPEQTISGNRVIEITRKYVVAFAELHLRNHPEPLLDGPSARYPEVTFQQ